MSMTKVFTFKVNDTEIASEFRKVLARELLELAVKNGAVQGRPEDYILKSLTKHNKQYQWDEEVDLQEDDQFITLLNTPVVVASTIQVN